MVRVFILQGLKSGFVPFHGGDRIQLSARWPWASEQKSKGGGDRFFLVAFCLQSLKGSDTKSLGKTPKLLET